MKIIKIDKTDWDDGLKKSADHYRLVGPTQEQDFYLYKPLKPGEAPDMSFPNTRLSAKGTIYPQSHTLFTYSLDPDRKDHHLLIEPENNDPPTAVIGIRPCDAAAFVQVRRNFDAPDYRDPYWLNAYENTVLVGLACDQPGPACFCTSTPDGGPYAETALDILLVDNDDHYLARIVSDKGGAFLEKAGWAGEVETDPAMQSIQTRKAEAENRIRSTIETDHLADAETMALYDAPFWEDVAFACINCGTCTFLCPTCWCFDIQDETHGMSGQRLRNWDSCMFPLFTRHGTGHNPRGEKVQRVRQRFMHKLKYYVDKYEAGVQCVGCGRCVLQCPVNIDIRNVCELMNNAGKQPVTCTA
jgi:ferredoxin